VIDKDFSAAKLAEIIDADMLIILTAVEKVAVNFGKPNQKWLDTMSVAEAKEYIAQEQFAKGSMLPKVEAAVSFVSAASDSKAAPPRRALITLLQKARDGIEGKTGTVITA
jgi:carbamate kinase